jgi:hypothetical protein
MEKAIQEGKTEADKKQTQDSTFHDSFNGSRF